MLSKEKKYFAETGQDGGILNAEDSFFAIGNNQWTNMENCRTGSTDKGQTAIVESIGGTLRLSEPSPSVTFTEIGSISDTVGRRTLYFYYNEYTSEHKIMCYSFDANTMYIVLLSSQVTGGLTFSKNYLIHGRVINGVAYWTDNYNAPRKLNIDAAIKMNQPSYSTTVDAYLNPLEASVISLIRKPPIYPLVPTKSTDGTIVVNNVADFAGEFSWRYRFRDNEVSVLATPSPLVNYNDINSTSNKITVVATDLTGTPEHIPQDVQIVDFCVRYGDSGGFFIFKSFDKRNTADALAIANNNAGISALSATFLNDVTGISLDNAYSIKPYDSVPKLTKTIETGIDRLLLANNLESYNTPIKTSLLLTPITDTNNSPFQNPIFHSGSALQAGMIFLDYYKRVIGNVVTNDTLRIQIPDRNYNLSSYTKLIQWNVDNTDALIEIPVDAHYFLPVLTKDLRTRFFLQSKSGGMQYAIKDAVTSVITYTDTYVSTAYGLAFDASLLTAEGLGYQWQENDIIKIYQALSSTIYSLAVIGQDGNYIISKLQDLGSFATQPDIIFEIYSPYKEAISEPYFTIGELLAIANPGDVTRNYGASLTGYFTGNVYAFASTSPTGVYNTEHMSPIVKYWRQWNVNAGEFNLVLTSQEVRKKTSTRWSNTIIEGTQNNGLSSFDALDEKILPLTLGAVQKLQQTSKVSEQGNIVLAIGEQETASCYLGEVQVVGASSNAFLATAPNVIGTVNIMKGSFGTVNPESVFEYRGNVYWLDANNGRYIQYSTNGLFPISNYKMQRFWKLWCAKYLSMTTAEIEALGGRPFVFTAVDPVHDELLISIPRLAIESPKGTLLNFNSNIDAETKMIYPFDILDLQGKTIVYDLKSDRWLGSYGFNPEGFSTLQNQLYSSKSGQLYLHNQYSNQCEFYGVQYKPRVMFVSNSIPNTPKIYNAIAIEANMKPTYTYLYNDYPYEQISDLVDYEYRSLEGIWNATFFRNIIQPTDTGYSVDGRLTGEKMRSVAMLFMIEFTVSGSTPLALKFVDIVYTVSSGNRNV